MQRQIQLSMVQRVLMMIAVGLLAACSSTAPYYKDSAGRVREPKPEDPRLPYAVQQGEFLKDENLWPYATRGPMKFLGEYQFSHKWFVVRGQCEYGRKLDSPDVIDADLTGFGRGFKPKSFVEGHTQYIEIVQRGNKLFQGNSKVTARIGPGRHDGYLSSVCKLQADPQLGRYSGEAAGAALSITDQSFDSQLATDKRGFCSRIANDSAYSRKLGVEHRSSGTWQTCIVERQILGQLGTHWEKWMMPLANTGYHLEVVWDLSRPVTLDPRWYDERQKAFKEVIDSVKFEKIQSSP